MKSTFRYHPAARREVREVVRFYTKADPRLGREFYDALENLIDGVLSHPDLGQTVESGCRRRLLPRFPCSLIYRDNGSVIEIIAVMHHRRRPGYWTDRTAEG